VLSDIFSEYRVQVKVLSCQSYLALPPRRASMAVIYFLGE